MNWTLSATVQTAADIIDMTDANLPDDATGQVDAAKQAAVILAKQLGSGPFNVDIAGRVYEHDPDAPPAQPQAPLDTVTVTVAATVEP